MKNQKNIYIIFNYLAQDWQLWCARTRYDGGRDVYRRSELYGSPRCLRSERWQKTTGCYGWKHTDLARDMQPDPFHPRPPRRVEETKSCSAWLPDWFWGRKTPFHSCSWTRALYSSSSVAGEASCLICSPRPKNRINSRRKARWQCHSGCICSCSAFRCWHREPNSWSSMQATTPWFRIWSPKASWQRTTSGHISRGTARPWCSSPIRCSRWPPKRFDPFWNDLLILDNSQEWSTSSRPCGRSSRTHFLRMPRRPSHGVWTSVCGPRKPRRCSNYFRNSQAMASYSWSCFESGWPIFSDHPSPMPSPNDWGDRDRHPWDQVGRLWQHMLHQ